MFFRSNEFHAQLAIAATGKVTAAARGMNGARSHEELIVWQLAYALKLRVYALIETGRIASDKELVKQLRGSSSSAPRLIAEGFGRYYPGEFSRYLRNANGELKETFDALRDSVGVSGISCVRRD